MPEIWEGKKYTNYHSDGFDDYMKELGKIFPEIPI